MPHNQSILLGVNIDHVATLRNARGSAAGGAARQVHRRRRVVVARPAEDRHPPAGRLQMVAGDGEDCPAVRALG
mgnify:CR=1 FL=1